MLYIEPDKTDDTRYIPGIRLLATYILMVANPNLVIRELSGFTRQAHQTSATRIAQEVHSN